MSGTHHKTGTVLMTQKIMAAISKYWISKCLNTNQTNKTNIMGNMYLHHNYFNAKHYMFIHANFCINMKMHCVLFHMIRNPVDTILSGYNYHKITIKEKWVNKKIRTIKILHCCEKLVEKLKDMNTYYLNNSLQKIYNMYDISVGIEIEYYRYSFCEWNEIYRSYQEIKQKMMLLKYNTNDYIHIRNMRLEQFYSEYNGTIQIVLNGLGILQFEHRNNLLNILQKFNVKNVKYNVKGDGHITKGRYNKTMQVNILLRDITRCVILKRKTELLGYLWTYHMYC
eukprot:19011_1